LSGAVVVWLVNGNGTGMRSPNSKRIVDIVVGIAPDFRKSGFAGRGSDACKRALLGAQRDEMTKSSTSSRRSGGSALIFSISD
jgi:hypothetical protein